MQVEPSPTPRTTTFWQEKLDKKELPKEKIAEIFEQTIEYFRREQENEMRIEISGGYGREENYIAGMALITLLNQEYTKIEEKSS